MKTQILNIWDHGRRSFWFLPSLITLGITGTYFFIFLIPDELAHQATRALSWSYSGEITAARTLLATLASSIITVTGVSFSMTLVAITLASSQFGPRLLRNFVRSAGTQTVLGVFIATFTYCLLVLRLMDGEIEHMAKIQLATTVAILLALLCVLLLIYFIHHVTMSINVDNIISTIYAELHRTINRIFPKQPARRQKRDLHQLDELKAQDSQVVQASMEGYLQAIQVDKLKKYASNHSLYFEVRVSPGDFLIRKMAIASVHSTSTFPDQLQQDVNKFFLLGQERTPEQDVEFTIHQLVEVAIRALSPGINDPFTAISCINYLAAALVELGNRNYPANHLQDDSGVIQISLPDINFRMHLLLAFEPVYSYARNNRIVVCALLDAMTIMATTIGTDTNSREVETFADKIIRDVEQSFTDRQADLAEVQRHFKVFRKSIEDRNAE